MASIFHVTTADVWDAAVAEGEYRQSTLDRTLEEEGFIHCSTAAQVPGTLRRFYQGIDDLVRLEIDPDQVKGRPVKLRGAGMAGRHGATRCDPVPTVRPGDVPGASVRSYSS